MEQQMKLSNPHIFYHRDHTSGSGIKHLFFSKNYREHTWRERRKTFFFFSKNHREHTWRELRKTSSFWFPLLNLFFSAEMTADAPATPIAVGAGGRTLTQQYEGRQVWVGAWVATDCPSKWLMAPPHLYGTEEKENDPDLVRKYNSNLLLKTKILN